MRIYCQRISIYRNLLNIILFLIVVFFTGIEKTYSATKGPIAIDILGYDFNSKIVFFTRTDWSDCNCETDLYKYHINADSIEIITSWCKRGDYARDKATIIKGKGLGLLTKLTPLSNSNHSVYLFAWLPKEKEFSSSFNTNVENYPFQLEIGKTIYQYVQCFSKSINPRIKHYRIGENTGFILVTYKGDCNVGNTQDVLIIYRKTTNKLVSREVK